jgi:hypothetical protein
VTIIPELMPKYVEELDKYKAQEAVDRAARRLARALTKLRNRAKEARELVKFHSLHDRIGGKPAAVAIGNTAAQMQDVLTFAKKLYDADEHCAYVNRTLAGRGRGVAAPEIEGGK